MLAALVAATVAAVAAVIALVVALTGGPGPVPSPTTPLPTLAGRPPTDVALRDAGETVTVSWGDPAEGRVSFIVTGGRAGEQLRAMGQLGPGRTDYQLNGLNPGLEYCFSVVAVYGRDQLAASTAVCTARAGRARPRRTG